ncbi:MAG: hypothetical protein E4H27_03665 [Anaerolineales bacterium]|nr:MAG: hypothetical protein E4H27_03665 [Anaerolineales bacterium]
MSSTIHLSDRVFSLREQAFRWKETQTATIGQRLFPALKGLAACSPAMPWMKRKSAMLAHIIRESETVVHENELLVGYNYYGGDDGQWMEVAFPRLTDIDQDKLVSYLHKGLLEQTSIDFIFSSLYTIDTLIPMVGFSSEKPDSVRTAEEEGIFWCYATPENHTVIDYEKVVATGFDKLADEIRQHMAALTIDSAEGYQAQMLMESMLTVTEAASEIGARYANKIRALQDQCTDSDRALELERMVQVLKHVPAKPARTFHEALQSLWFAHIINTWEDGINANSLGRLDQILYPYYQNDITAGRLSREEAFELLCCFWIKLYRDYDVQQVVLGGVDAQGQDAANELTYLMLDVTEALDFIRCLSVRLHRGSPQALLRRALEIVSKGKGVPFFFNDEVLIPALVDNGIALEDARDYAAIGCVEITIPGKANPHAVSSRINLLKCLELTLNNGTSMLTGKRLGPETGDPAEWHSIDAVISAFEIQVDYFVHQICRETLRLGIEYSLTKPMPYKSLLTEGCLASGRDFNYCGAKYDFHESMPMGIPNVADSLAAIERLVFIEQRYTLMELIEQMRNNFPLESTRLECLRRTPKYGNDDDAVDRFACYVFEHYCRLMGEVSTVYDTKFFAQPFTYLWLVEAGKLTAATPDGRKNGENLAYSISPMQGRDFKGLTAVINSLAKLPQHLAAGSTSAIIEVEPVLFTEEHIDHLVTLLKTTSEKGVGQLQFNVVSAETLRKAQSEPENYRNLAVRVSGFSQKFCLLNKELQDHIIARTKHGSF